MKARTRRGNGWTPGRVKLALAAALALGLGGCLGYEGQVVHGKRENALLACEALRRSCCCNPSDGPIPGRHGVNNRCRSGTNCRAFRQAEGSIFLLFYSSLRPEALLKFKAHNQIA